MKELNYDFTSHLYLLARHLNGPLTMKYTSEEWDWWVQQHNIELNAQSWQEYADAVLFCKSLIEDYPG